ncbi:hypothetical protein C0583_05605 [Candidatus Parcubacteria bacterium]|nr:MAG: hypothetical protein C0583_05605 [Candidatus Parcubacteria bacterium]
MVRDEIIGTHKVNCKGVDKNNGKVLPEAENVIVKIYKSGLSKPLCRHFKKVSNLDVCNASNKKSDDILEFGDCPFYTS